MDTSNLIPNQVPEHIRESYPKFISFLQSYYDYLEQYNVEMEKIRDVDLTQESLYKFLNNEIAKNFPEAIINQEKLYWAIRDIYRSKGTIHSIELLFKVFFNDAVTIYQPGNDILRASGGDWRIQRSITFRQLEGSFNIDELNIFVVENEFGNFFIEPINIEIVDNQVFRIFFYNNTQVILNEDKIQNIYVYSSGGENKIFKGEIIKSPSSITVLDPGKYWKLGQSLRIEGSIKDTIAKVTGITEDGGLTRVEIFEYGYDHSDNQLERVSSLPYKPLLTEVDYYKEVTGYIGDTPIYSHYLTIDDGTEGFKEEIQGLTDKQGTTENYFLELYNEETGDGYYNGFEIFSQKEYWFVDKDTSYNDAIDPIKYYDSIATLRYDYNYITSYRGRYNTDSGLISNSAIKTQDNVFYQMFSYLVETTKNIEVYKNTLDKIHPAGLIYFSNLAQTALIPISPTGFSTVTLKKEFQYEDVDINTLLVTKHLYKPEFDDINTTEDIVRLFTKVLADNNLLTEQVFKNNEKIFNDITNIMDAENSTLALIPSYDEGFYFAEDYALLDRQLTLY